MQVIIQGDQPELGIFSGIHGDEWGIIPAVEKAVVKYKTQLNSFVFIPVCSPSAVRQKTRLNSEGIDLNRSFLKNPESREVQEIIAVLKPYTFKLCVDFHEDTELAGIYLYDSENIEGSETLASFRNQIRRIAPLYTGTDTETDEKLGGISHDGYRVSAPPEKDTDGNFIYEGFFDYWAIINGKTKRWMTLEVPTSLTAYQKNEVVDIFFRVFLIS